MYTVAEVRSGVDVTLTSPKRKDPSVLRWSEIERVFTDPQTDPTLTPKAVDDILNRQVYYSSTMCALVLAMLDSIRLQRI
jgi:hypothetical protein